MCCFHLLKFAYDHAKAILQFAGKRDCDFLVAAVAPYLVEMPTDAVADLGVSSRTCVKWSIYREKWIFALLEGQKVLMDHDDCDEWRRTVKPFLLQRINKPNEIVFIPARGYKDKLGVRDIHREAVKYVVDWYGERGRACCRFALDRWKDCTLDKLETLQFPN